jgi:hypothetical protein
MNPHSAVICGARGLNQWFKTFNRFAPFNRRIKRLRSTF